MGDLAVTLPYDKIWSDTFDMIVQIHVDTGEAIEKYDKFSKQLSACVRENQFGTYDGSEAILGGRNFYIFRIKKTEWANALELVRELLDRFEFLPHTIIARQILWETITHAGEQCEVVWPLDKAGEFYPGT